MIRTRPLLGALVTAAVAVFMLAAYGGSSEGTVVAKTDKGVYDYACQTGATVTGPVAVPVWGVCSVPKCWRLVVRDIDGTTFEPCVSREEYNRMQLGAYWHGRTDRRATRSPSRDIACWNDQPAWIGDRCSERSMSPQAV